MISLPRSRVSTASFRLKNFLFIIIDIDQAITMIKVTGRGT